MAVAVSGIVSHLWFRFSSPILLSKDHTRSKSLNPVLHPAQGPPTQLVGGDSESQLGS